MTTQLQQSASGEGGVLFCIHSLSPRALQCFRFLRISATQRPSLLGLQFFRS